MNLDSSEMFDNQGNWKVMNKVPGFRPVSEDLSTKERDMFTVLGLAYLFGANLMVSDLYRIAIEQCFLDNTQTPAAESLRRTWKAFRACAMYRMTKEFDDLIQLVKNETTI